MILTPAYEGSQTLLDWLSLVTLVHAPQTAHLLLIAFELRLIGIASSLSVSHCTALLSIMDRVVWQGGISNRIITKPVGRIARSRR
jgi:hypothetical protein